jgi:hypothetical protein
MKNKDFKVYYKETTSYWVFVTAKSYKKAKDKVDIGDFDKSRRLTLSWVREIEPNVEDLDLDCYSSNKRKKKTKDADTELRGCNAIVDVRKKKK